VRAQLIPAVSTLYFHLPSDWVLVRMIAGVEAQSAAADKRLSAGDVVVEISQEAVAEASPRR
jgi:hypothetical protein